MESLLFFNNISLVTCSLVVLSVYLVSSIAFGTTYSGSTILATPNLLNCFNTFTVFYFFVTFLLLCFDFDFTNSLTFFNQHIQLVFLLCFCFLTFVSRDFFSFRIITKFEYDILLIFVAISSICLCFSNDFLIFYLAIELQSLAFYVFASFQRNSDFSAESGLKYFVFGAIISCFLLLGFVFIYLHYGTCTIETLFSLMLLETNDSYLIGILFLLIALLFKVGAAPFHSWLCDVYDGSTLSVTFLFATAPKIILFSLFVKLFFFAFYNFQDILLPFFLFSALSSIAVGSFSAIYQKRIKRLFAYSTIAHSGFILLAVVAGSLDSAKSSIFYIFAYAFLTLLLFSILIYVTTAISNFPKYLVNWTSFGFKNPILAITFTFTLFSIAGIPPLLGFFSKFFVLFSVVAKDFYFTSFVVIVLSSIACFYYIRLIKIFYFTKTSKHNLWISNKSSKNAEWVISLLLFINLTFFTKPELLSSFALVTSLSLF